MDAHAVARAVFVTALALFWGANTARTVSTSVRSTLAIALSSQSGLALQRMAIFSLSVVTATSAALDCAYSFAAVVLLRDVTVCRVWFPRSPSCVLGWGV